ncbi:hypothetical protein C7212DRAFT_345410 [Tuber magnatum]|uniref:Uncharacterized protein n=1 Tax=Tuber magnatum TaxID=42249 RepID=A0A317SLT9_9PEZI|nr:hypothetical protein C7212DRAFT_345410 [Tuber magnatum]
MSVGDTRIVNLPEDNVETSHTLPIMQTVNLNLMAHDITGSPMVGGELKKEEKTTPTVTIATPIGDQIPATPATQHTFQKHREIAAGSAPSPIPPGNPPTSDNFKTAQTKAPRRSMRILELAQKPAKDKVTISSGSHGWEPTEETLITKEAPATQPASEISVKSVRKVKSRILDPRGGAGVTKNTVNQRLGAQRAAKAKSKDKVGKEVRNIRVNHANPIEKNPNITTTNKVPQTRRKVTPEELLNGTERRTRILRWLELSAATHSGPNAAKPPTKPGAPILEPKAGAGITKQTLDGRLPGQMGRKSKANAKMEVEVGEGRYATAGVTENTNSSNLPNTQIPSQPIHKTVSPILKPKDGAGVTKKTVKPGVRGQSSGNTTAGPKHGTTKPKARAGGKKKTAAERIREETAILMTNLELLKSADAELSRLIAECRGMKSEDTTSVESFNNILPKSPVQEAETGAGPSQGVSSSRSMETSIKSVDTIEE